MCYYARLHVLYYFESYIYIVNMLCDYVLYICADILLVYILIYWYIYMYCYTAVYVYIIFNYHMLGYLSCWSRWLVHTYICYVYILLICIFSICLYYIYICVWTYNRYLICIHIWMILYILMNIYINCNLNISTYASHMIKHEYYIFINDVWYIYVLNMA